MVEHIYKEQLEPIERVNQANVLLMDYALAVADYLILDDKEKMEAKRAEINEFEKKLLDMIAQEKKTDLSADDRDLIDQFSNVWPQHKTSSKTIMALAYDGKDIKAKSIRIQTTKPFLLEADAARVILSDLNQEDKGKGKLILWLNINSIIKDTEGSI